MLKIEPARLIVIPDKYAQGFLTDFYKYLSLMLSSLLNAKVVNSSEFNPNQYLQLVVVVSVVHWRIEDMRKLDELSNSIEIICWHDDIFWISDEAKIINESLFNRAHLILHGSKHTFLDLWEEHSNKSFWLPLFAAPYFHQSYNASPKFKCLLSGHCSEPLYPIRNKIKKAPPSCVDILGHPGYQANDSKCVREKYAELLNNYFCCVADSGRAYGACRFKITGEQRIFSKHIDSYLEAKMGKERLRSFKTKGQVLLKYFEIPASGALLIADENALEMSELGYEPNKNFIPVDAENVLSVITDCCLNPQKYEAVRQNGWRLSSLHTIEHREQKLKQIFVEANVKM